MNCPECGKEMTPMEEIEYLNRKIKKLESELTEEKAKPKIQIPTTPIPRTPNDRWPIYPAPGPWCGSGGTGKGSCEKEFMNGHSNLPPDQMTAR
jgi:hypothetical protein